MKIIVKHSVYILILFICFSCQKYSNTSNKEPENPLYGIWKHSQTHSQDGVTLQYDIDLTFHNDSTGSFETVIFSSILGDPIYDKKNFHYSIDGNQLNLKLVGSDDVLNLTLKDFSENTFVLCDLDKNMNAPGLHEIVFEKTFENPDERKDKQITGDPNKIWILTLGQSLDDAKIILKRNNYDYNEDEYGLKGHQQVEFMGFNWDYVDIAKSYDNKIKRIIFRKKNYPLLDELQKEIIVSKLDESYGEHRLDNTTISEYQFWSWQNGEYHVSFSCLDDLNSQELVFEK